MPVQSYFGDDTERPNSLFWSAMLEKPALAPVQGNLWRDEFRATLALAWPLILSNLTMALIQATDVVLMGWLGPRALAASALGLNLCMSMTIFCMGLVIAAAPMMAADLGRRFNAVREVRRWFRQSVWVACVAVIPAWVVLWNTDMVLLALGQDKALAATASTFMRGYMWSMLPFLIFQALRGFVSALERPGWILTISIWGVVMNAVLGWALIFGHFGLPALGIFGGGLTTTIVWSIMAGGLACVAARQKAFRRFHILGHFWRSDWPRFGKIVRLGVPIALTLWSEGAVFAAAVGLMGLISEASVAAHAVALQIAALSFMVPLGLGQAATVRVGLGYGRKDPEALRRAGWTAFMLGTGFMTCMAILMWSFPHQLIELFLEPTAANAPVIDLAVSFLGVAAAFQIFDGAQVVGAGMLRGLQDTRWPMIFAIVGYWAVGIGAGSFLAFRLELHGVGVWIGLAGGLAAVSLLMIWRWSWRKQLGLLPV
ncbi:MATE family efflux transporter [Aquisediminimonas profunda]|uniref:MATE family efflux transporter n=1 Tax=Aquisediminimonas profunda TaxID=1550733 RepID=UPI0031B8915B